MLCAATIYSANTQIKDTNQILKSDRQSGIIEKVKPSAPLEQLTLEQKTKETSVQSMPSDKFNPSLITSHVEEKKEVKNFNTYNFGALSEVLKYGLFSLLSILGLKTLWKSIKFFNLKLKFYANQKTSRKMIESLMKNVGNTTLLVGLIDDIDRQIFKNTLLIESDPDNKFNFNLKLVNAELSKRCDVVNSKILNNLT